MLWNSRQDCRPNFIWDAGQLHRAEWLFLSESGLTADAARRLDEVLQSQLVVRNLKDNCLASFEIDGEVLDPDAVESSIRRRLGLAFHYETDCAAEMGAAGLAAAVLRDEESRIDAGFLFGWHEKYAGRLFPGSPGPGRQLNAGAERELQSFFRWCEDAAGDRDSPLLRAGLAHLWFESMHLFGAATGVLGRALTERFLMLAVASRNFIPVSMVLAKYRHEYHRTLDEACRDRDAGRWLPWFAAAAVEAGRIGRARLDYAVNWRAFALRMENRVTGRQGMLLRRIHRRGMPEDFQGMTVAEAAAVEGVDLRNAQKELSALIEAEALIRVRAGGEYRYRLNIPSPEVARVFPADIA